MLNQRAALPEIDWLVQVPGPRRLDRVAVSENINVDASDRRVHRQPENAIGVAHKGGAGINSPALLVQRHNPVPANVGACTDDADTQIDGVLGVYVQADWETMRDDEMRARNPVPQQVTMRQARLALLSAGLLDDVEVVIAAAGRAAQLEWEYAAVVDRSNPVIVIVQQQQGMTDAEIDDLFREAAKL